MKRAIIRIAGVIILFIAINVVLAQGQSQKSAARRETPSRMGQPMRTHGRQVDANEMARREQMRKQMREQMQQEEMRRRRSTRSGPMDANALIGVRGRDRRLGKFKDESIPKTVGPGEQHKQQLMAVNRQMQAEQAKHRERLAKLTRIRKLAEQKGDAETVGRVDKLLEKDRQRYEAVTQRMERRKKAITEFMEKAAADKNKSGAGADTNKP